MVAHNTEGWTAGWSFFLAIQELSQEWVGQEGELWLLENPKGAVLSLHLTSEGLEDYFVVHLNPQCAVFPGKKTNNNRSRNTYRLLNGLPSKWGSGRQFPATLFQKGKQRELFLFQALSGCFRLCGYVFTFHFCFQSNTCVSFIFAQKPSKEIKSNQTSGFHLSWILAWKISHIYLLFLKKLQCGGE